MKRYFALFLALIMCLSITACTPDSDDSSDPVVTPSVKSAELGIGDTLQVNYTVEPAGTPVEFVSSDTSVLTVDANGLVSAVANGSATVIISAGDYSKAYVDVTVKAPVMQGLPNLLMNADSVMLYVDTEYDLVASVNKAGEILSDVSVSWASSDETVAKVTDGVVTAVGTGEAVITAAAEVEGQTLTAESKVTVCDYYEVVIDGDSINASIGTEFTLDVKIYDAEGNQVSYVGDDIEWFTSDPSSIQINDGIFKVISTGTPSAGVRYKGNVASVPVDIFSVTANFLSAGTEDFYGEVGGETFSGVVYKSTAYQPYFYFSEYGIQQIKAYAEANGYKALRIHAYPIQLDNGFMIGDAYIGNKTWGIADVDIDSITEEFAFWSQSQGMTENYMWFEFV